MIGSLPCDVLEAQTFLVTDACRGLRLDRFLQRMLPRMSRNAIQGAIRTRVCLASGDAPRPAMRPKVGDTVTIAPRAEPGASRGAAWATIVVPVLAESAGWVVVDKPAGVASTPTARRRVPDVATLLGLAPAHRLDLETSGCLLLTRDAATARAFDVAFRAGRIDKEYLALVAGVPEADVFEVDAPLGIDATSRVPNKVAVLASGRNAATRVEVVARGADAALVRAVPRTGRRHQIRVHLAHAGHAIVGDLLYGGSERRFVARALGQRAGGVAGDDAERLRLHAHRLGFADPASGRAIRVEAPVPARFYAGHEVAASPSELALAKR